MIIHGRSDATLNPGGVLIGTAEIYNQVEQMPEVLEALAPVEPQSIQVERPSHRPRVETLHSPSPSPVSSSVPSQ